MHDEYCPFSCGHAATCEQQCLSQPAEIDARHTGFEAKTFDSTPVIRSLQTQYSICLPLAPTLSFAPSGFVSKY
ncbi:hypothetical protein BAUCODRAFT_32977 [Baudoinia panamericana UAMH 10762]|uniref:Uncharacterized protein n=1 Tax=Baudoinia panamericana (strain UAMH 10762) TaxID=717646 RepID=M2N002_BAUPA|nr:uncharacterized protein BAUCODRAFT_32977 [Baudoinia panamericana UAMH 10762]EMC97233.1 hypothetical protein BAUCODRAFT_32977 [Baudoinia panamericana UAMH 10762]